MAQASTPTNGKHYWLKFHVSDWQADSDLRMCSYAVRGFWLECLCIMHKAKRRGYLETPTGLPITPDDVGRITGGDKAAVEVCVKTLLSAGIPSIEADSGVWFSRRMVRDSKAKEDAKAWGLMGGSPLLKKKNKRSKNTKIPRESLKGGDNPPLNPPPRERDPIIDAIALTENTDLAQVTAPAWSRYAKARQTILQACPDVTPDEIKRRAQNWGEHFRDATYTANALATHWGRLDADKKRPTRKQVDDNEYL